MRSFPTSRVTTLLALAATTAIVVLAAGCGEAESGVAAPTAAATEAPPDIASQAVDAEHNAADVMFAQMMIPHHEQAVVMSEDALAISQDPVVLDLAGRIKAAQQPEIDLMTTWLESWGMSAMMSDDDMAGMGHDMAGMMSEEDMIALRAATGTDFDRKWLELMIEHHEGAIEMAENVLTSGSSTAVRALAEDIVSSQQAEIDEMADRLADA